MKAVLWDFDGTLADTENVWREVEAALIAEYGLDYPPELVARLTGVDTKETGRILAEMIPGQPMTGDEVSDLVVQRVREFVQTHPIPFKPGAKELLDELLAAAVPCALVSASPGVVIHAAVDQLPSDTFGVVITSDDVSERKPDPEGYLRAAEALGVDARDCVVIEDSAVGIQAGHGAGAVVIGVPDHGQIPDRPRQVIRQSLAGVTLKSLTKTWQELRDTTAADEPWPQAILWDFDGTIANTELEWRAAQDGLLAEYGTSMTDAAAESLVGTGLEYASTFIASYLPEGTLSPAQVAAEMDRRVMSAMSDGEFPIKPGVGRILAQQLAAGIPGALVSTSSRQVLELAESRLGEHPLQLIIGAEDVSAAKPHPEAYLMAAEALGVDVTQVLVIEDSANGSAAGNAAGAVVIAVPDQVLVPAAERRVIVETLSGLTLADLRRLWLATR